MSVSVCACNYANSRTFFSFNFSMQWTCSRVLHVCLVKLAYKSIDRLGMVYSCALTVMISSDGNADPLLHCVEE